MNNLTYKDLDEAIDLIRRSNRIYIASHINPDGDNLGSSLALALALRKLGKEVLVLNPGSIPSDFVFLPGIDLIKDFEDDVDELDLFIVVDSGDIDRLGPNKDLLDRSKAIINIDHHITNTQFGNINLVDSKAAATGELIYQLLKRMDVKLDKDIATNIYTAISTDTGKFSYESVTSRTHRIAAELLDVGIDLKDINIKIYESYSLESTKLFIKALNTLKLYSDNRVALVKVSQRMLKETNASLDDTDGISSFIRGIGPVEVSCLLKEVEEGEIKVSLRSKNYVDVSKVCAKFNGGGHVRAAGCTIFEDLDTAEAMIIEEINRHLR
ncbi:MAG: bifunctional oligoribonuclease/PAP phosphatase NrnA [Tissierellia bacterium]|nr:bifunctional oligoribonuclease/PAP phosphatase NrnA [Tissierellia bacterium]